MTATPAQAEPPGTVTGYVTDLSDVITPEQEQELMSAADALRASEGIGVYVVFVEDFDDMDGKTWASQAYDASGLTRDDILVAVATTDRKYGERVGTNTGISGPEWVTIRKEFVPKLSSQDWDGAVGEIQAQVKADDTRPGTPAGGGEAQEPDTSSSGGSGAPLLALLGLGAAGAGGYALWRKRKKGTYSGDVPGLPSADPYAGVSTPEMNRRASEALVALDDEIRAASEELSFAQAEFGEERTKEYVGAVQSAREKSQEAFRIRRLLDDDVPETDAQQRVMLAQILALTDDARRLTSTHAAQFSEVRAIQADLPQALARLETRATEVEARMPIAEDNLQRLGTTYNPKALATVRDNVTQAAQLVSAARGSIATARAALDAGNRTSAVTTAKAAEQAISQANVLLDAVDRAGSDLVNASASLERAVASISSDIADASRLAPRDAAVNQAVSRATHAVTAGRSVGSDGDPLGALRELASAEREIDAVLAPYREAASAQEKTRGLLQERVLRAEGRMHSIDDFISTRRGAVQQSARARINSALQMLEEVKTGLANPQEDLNRLSALLDQGEALAEQAFAEAQSDVDQWGNGGGGFGGGFGGGRRGGGLDLGSLILGGIIFGGGHGHGGSWGGGGDSGGGFGGGGFGGGFDGGGFGGDFGGGFSGGGDF